jgi:hypothetical protein
MASSGDALHARIFPACANTAPAQTEIRTANRNTTLWNVKSNMMAGLARR